MYFVLIRLLRLIHWSQLALIYLFQFTMKLIAVVVVGIAALFTGAEAGGYVAKGGVYDFKRPLDYLDQAVKAGKL